MPPEKPQPKFVSWAEYLRYRSKKAALTSVGPLLYIPGVLCLVISGVWMLIFTVARIMQWSEHDFAGLFIPLFGSCGWILTWCGKRAMAKADQMEPVQPLTRQSATQLPEEESLLRASSASSSPQDELLRAASFGQETPAEELLRSTSGEGS